MGPMKRMSGLPSTFVVLQQRLEALLDLVRDERVRGPEVDLVEVRARHGKVAVVGLDPIEAAGVNTPEQLAALEASAAQP